MNRDDYMNGTVDHHTYYCALADAIGRTAIERLVLAIAPLRELTECLATDEHLNNIRLAKWDGMDPAVRRLVRHEHMAISWSDAAQPIAPGRICWSLSESVCVLKAAARRMVKEALARTNSDLYDQVVAAGLPIDSHESDLYIKVTPASTALVTASGRSYQTFTSNIDGQLWYDVPFAFAPWWTARLGVH